MDESVKFLIRHKNIWFDKPYWSLGTPEFRELYNIAVEAGICPPDAEERAKEAGVPVSVVQITDSWTWFARSYVEANNFLVREQIPKPHPPHFVCNHAYKRVWVTPTTLNMAVCTLCGTAESASNECSQRRKKNWLWGPRGKCEYDILRDPACKKCLYCGNAEEGRKGERPRRS